MNTEKVKMSQDTLYKYLTDHDVKISRIAELMGMSLAAVVNCFKHSLNSHGYPRSFSVENIGKLNDALQKFVFQLRSSLITFGSDKMYTNKHGRTYDPGMIEPINYMGELLNMTSLIKRLLGWSKTKKLSIFSSPSSKNYGNISESDVTAINAEALSIAGVLENVEVVPDENAFKGYGSDRSSSSTI